MKHAYTFRNNSFNADRLSDLADVLVQEAPRADALSSGSKFSAALQILQETESNSDGIKDLLKFALVASDRLLSAKQKPLCALRIAATVLPRLEDGSKNSLYRDTVASLTNSLLQCAEIGGQTAAKAKAEMESLRSALNPRPLAQVFPRMDIARSTLTQDMAKYAQSLGPAAAARFARFQEGATSAPITQQRAPAKPAAARPRAQS